MGKGGRRRDLPRSPLHRGGPSRVGLQGRGFVVSLVKLPVVVNATTPAELVEKTESALVETSKKNDPT